METLETKQIKASISYLVKLYNSPDKKDMYSTAIPFINGVMLYYLKHNTITYKQAESISRIVPSHIKFLHGASICQGISTLGGNGDPDDIDMDGRYEDQPY